MAKLDKITKGCSGYFRSGEEESFPWDATSGIWYSLLVVEDGTIEKYGFTASKTQKESLKLALQELDLEDGEEAILMGVWTGQYNTHLFILDIEKSIKKLEEL